jgi:hypothetical protein
VKSAHTPALVHAHPGSASHIISNVYNEHAVFKHYDVTDDQVQPS